MHLSEDNSKNDNVKHQLEYTVLNSYGRSEACKRVTK